MGVIFGLALVAGCVCTSVEVENASTGPIFVNDARHRGDSWADDEGVLLAPGETEEFFYVHNAHIRVRTLNGETIALHEVSDDADDDIRIEDLTPLDSAPPVNPASYALGPTSSSAILCIEGDEVKKPLFRTLVMVESESQTPLVVNLRGDWQNPLRDWRRGVLLPPTGSAHVYEEVIEFGWLLAHTPEGDLIFSEEVPRAERSSVVIPNDVANSVEEPQDLYPGSCQYAWGLILVVNGSAAALAGLVGAAIFIARTFVRPKRATSASKGF